MAESIEERLAYLRRSLKEAAEILDGSLARATAIEAAADDPIRYAKSAGALASAVEWAERALRDAVREVDELAEMQAQLDGLEAGTPTPTAAIGVTP